MGNKISRPLATFITIAAFLLSIILGLGAFYVVNDRISNLFSDAFGWAFGIFGIAAITRVFFWWRDR